jgi:subtilisin-like proprotein convertase family protein
LTPGGTFTFSNPAPITIPDSGTATPYPSTINVSGIPTGHVVTKVTVTINDFNHTWPRDVGVALRGPGGQICVLFNNAIGGSGGVTNRTYTFDQAFPPLPTSGFPPSGTYGPNNNSATRIFTGLGSPPYNSNLNIFNGLSGASVNGTWELFVQDFASGDAGNINGGWSITIQTGTPDCTTTASCAVLQNCRVSLGITGQTLLGSTCGPPNYAGDLVLTAVLTNTSTQTISDVFVQVVGLGYPDSTPTGVIVASPNPHRLLTADGATCSSGGQAGADQSTVNGQAPIGSNTPIGTLNPGGSRTLTFRIALPAIRRLRFFVNVFGVGGTACPVALNEGRASGPVMATTMSLEGPAFGFEVLRDKGRLTVEPLASGTAMPGTPSGRRR